MGPDPTGFPQAPEDGAVPADMETQMCGKACAVVLLKVVDCFYASAANYIFYMVFNAFIYLHSICFCFQPF